MGSQTRSELQINLSSHLSVHMNLVPRLFSSLEGLASHSSIVHIPIPFVNGPLYIRLREHNYYMVLTSNISTAKTQNLDVSPVLLQFDISLGSLD